MSDCLYDSCNNERRDMRGSKGRFCSDECMKAYSAKQKREMTKTTAALAEKLADELCE